MKQQQVHGIRPASSLGIAGTFIGDQAFSDCYQIPYKQVMEDCWWQVRRVSSCDVRSVAMDVAFHRSTPARMPVKRRIGEKAPLVVEHIDHKTHTRNRRRL